MMKFFLSREFLLLLMLVAIGVFAFDYAEKLTLTQIRMVMGLTTPIFVLVMIIIVGTIIDHHRRK